MDEQPTPGSPRLRLGLISDTHGKLPAWVEGVFEGVDAILHAGDIDSPQVLDSLECLAPVHAVAGNMDRCGALADLPPYLRLDIGGVRVLLVHEPSDAELILGRLPADLVVVGHIHRPAVRRVGDVLYVNPGSASRSRGDGHSVALLDIADGVPRAEIVREPPSHRRAASR